MIKASTAMSVTLASLVLGSCSSTERFSKEPESVENAIVVTPCELMADPGRYDHKLIKISGKFYHGFEGSFIGDPSCTPKFTDIWVEYGGTRGMGTVFAGGPSSDRQRPEPLIVDGITTTLTTDSKFLAMDGLIHSRKRAELQVTVIGRYFAGNVETGINGRPFWAGFGHLYGYTLLVVQQVVAVKRTLTKDG